MSCFFTFCGYADYLTAEGSTMCYIVRLEQTIENAGGEYQETLLQGDAKKNRNFLKRLIHIKIELYCNL